MKIKVYPTTNTIALEKETMKSKETVAVGIEQMSITYLQNADTNSPSDDLQTITITTQTAAPTEIDEEGYYFDITIPEGQHWSVDSGEELKALIDDFKKRLYPKAEK